MVSRALSERTGCERVTADVESLLLVFLDHVRRPDFGVVRVLPNVT
jgi:hypothetical protein